MILRVKPDNLSFNNNLQILSFIPGVQICLCYIFHIYQHKTYGGIKHIKHACDWQQHCLHQFFTTAVSLLADIWLNFLNTLKSHLWYHPQFNSVHIWNTKLYSHIIVRCLQNVFWHCSSGVWRLVLFF